MSPSHRCCHGTAVHEVYEEVTELLPSCPVPVMCPHFFANTPSAALCLAAFPSWASEQVGFSPSKPLRLKRAPLMEVQTPSGTQVVAKGLTSCHELDKPNRSLGRRVRSRKPLRDRWTPGVASLAEVCSSGGRPQLGCKWDFVGQKHTWLPNPPDICWGSVAASQSCGNTDLKCTSIARMNSPFLSSCRYNFFTISVPPRKCTVFITHTINPALGKKNVSQRCFTCCCCVLEGLGGNLMHTCLNVVIKCLPAAFQSNLASLLLQRRH